VEKINPTLALKNSDIQWHTLNIDELLKKYEISLQPQNPIRVVMIITHKYQAIKRESDTWGMVVLKRGIEIQAKALFEEKNVVEFVDAGSGEFIALIQPKQPDMKPQNIKNTTSKLHIILNRIMGISVGIIVSREAPIEHLHYQWRQCTEQKEVLFKSGLDTIYIGEQSPSVASYSTIKAIQFDIEARLQESIVTKEKEKALEHLSAIIDIVRPYPAAILKSTLLHIAFLIHKCFTIIVSNSGLEIKPYDFSKIIQTIQEADTLSEVHTILKEMVYLIEAESESLVSSQHSSLVSSAKEIIERDYGDIQLYRVSIADQIGVSPDYLSRIFTKATGKSINKYIADVRMNQAEIMLRNPSISIYDILVHCGYNSESWFYKQFKQKYGVTPLEFRRGYLRHKIKL